MTTAAFLTTAVPLTTPLIATHNTNANTILRPFILIGAVAFVVGFMGYVVVGRPHTAVAQDRYQAPAAVSTPASSAAPDAWNSHKPV